MSTHTLGRYQIIREIARSNDIVYEARDPVMGRRVALKELALPPSLTGQARRERIERFYREAKAAGSLSPHPHIVTIYEVGQQGDRYFIAMEYLEGQPLRDILQVGGPLPVERARRIAVQVCLALEHAHARGVIHRDIKPDNIHILPGDIAKLTDFGIARITADPALTADGQVFGTPSYMSPEQVAGKPLDARTDIYSLGVTLYEMVTGRKPFTGDSVVTITYNIMNQEPPPMTGVPADIEEVVLRAMAKDPEARYPSAAAMRAVLTAPPAQTRRQLPGSPGATATPPAAGPAPLQRADAWRAPAATAGWQAAPPQPSGPEPTPLQPPPLYVPCHPSLAGQLLRRHAHILSLLGIAIAISAVLAGLAWVGTVAYQNYQVRALQSRAAADVKTGVRLYNGKRFVEAAALFERALAVAPNSDIGRLARENAAKAWASHGNLMLERRRLSEAEQAYQAALRHDPEMPLAHYGLGLVYNLAGRTEAAMGEWAWVLQNDPRSDVAQKARYALAVAHFNEGVHAYRAGQEDEAVGHWNECIRVAPGTPIANSAETMLQRVLAESANRSPW